MLLCESSFEELSLLLCWMRSKYEPPSSTLSAEERVSTYLDRIMLVVRGSIVQIERDNLQLIRSAKTLFQNKKWNQIIWHYPRRTQSIRKREGPHAAVQNFSFPLGHLLTALSVHSIAQLNSNLNVASTQRLFLLGLWWQYVFGEPLRKTGRILNSFWASINYLLDRYRYVCLSRYLRDFISTDR